MRMMISIPDEDSSLSSLLTSQSKLLENCVQLFLFPRINAAAGEKKSVHESQIGHSVLLVSGVMDPQTQQGKQRCPKPRNRFSYSHPHIYSFGRCLLKRQ